MKLDSRLAPALAAAAVLAAGLALLDPRLAPLAAVGPVIAIVALAPAAPPQRRRLLPAALVAAAFGIAACCPIEFRADSASYYAYLRSAVFDRDLDFANEWEHWEYSPAPLTETGHRRNVQSIGPALLWSPFYVMAHAYVRLDQALGGRHYSADGYSTPYRRAAALGTVGLATVGCLLLGRALAWSHGGAVAGLATAATLIGSPVLYYTFVVPTMAHGAAFGATAGLVWAWNVARRAPSAVSWIRLGALLGAAALMRWQAVVYVLLVLPLVAHGLRRGTLRAWWPLAGAAAALVVFAPQLLAWRVLFGRWLTLPQGPGFMDWSSPRLIDALVSADHGLFTWTPLLALGAVGLLLGIRRDAVFHAGALAVFAAAAWVNGAVTDWAASDAFGARRFDVVLPLLAAGLAQLLSALRPGLARFPLAAPASLLAGLCLWNLGLVASFRQGRFPESAPLERLAHDQALNLRRAAQSLMGALMGARGRAFVYKALSAEYVYSGNPGGTISLADADERYLLEGWGSRGRRSEGPAYRWALFPQACLRLALEEPFELPLSITIRAPGRAGDQTLTLVANGRAAGTATVTPEWQELAFTLRARDLVAGENLLCLRFSAALPGEEGARVAAAVATVQLP